MDDKIYCKKCTKIIIVKDQGNNVDGFSKKVEEHKNGQKIDTMIVCFHCELLTNKSNKSVVKRFTNKLDDKAN